MWPEQGCGAKSVLGAGTLQCRPCWGHSPPNSYLSRKGTYPAPSTHRWAWRVPSQQKGRAGASPNRPGELHVPAGPPCPQGLGAGSEFTPQILCLPSPPTHSAWGPNMARSQSPATLVTKAQHPTPETVLPRLHPNLGRHPGQLTEAWLGAGGGGQGAAGTLGPPFPSSGQPGPLSQQPWTGQPPTPAAVPSPSGLGRVRVRSTDCV